MHQSLRGGIVGALIYYYFADASTICDASMHDSGPCETGKGRRAAAAELYSRSETGRGGGVQLQNSAAAVRQEGGAAVGECCSCSHTGRGELQLQNSAAAVRREGRAAAADFCTRSEGNGEGLQLQNSAATVRQEGEGCSCRLLQPQRGERQGLQLQNSAAAALQPQ